MCKKKNTKISKREPQLMIGQVDNGTKGHNRKKNTTWWRKYFQLKNFPAVQTVQAEQIFW